jgi:hypothetical protein
MAPVPAAPILRHNLAQSPGKFLYRTYLYHALSRRTQTVNEQLTIRNSRRPVFPELSRLATTTKLTRSPRRGHTAHDQAFRLISIVRFADGSRFCYAGPITNR